jgi:hypothetical protein
MGRIRTHRIAVPRRRHREHVQPVRHHLVVGRCQPLRQLDAALPGIGLLVERGGVRPKWALALLVTGVGSLLAILWELGEWYTFIRHSSELATAYEDTLGDEALGSLGGLTAALILTWLRATGPRRAPSR